MDHVPPTSLTVPVGRMKRTRSSVSSKPSGDAKDGGPPPKKVMKRVKPAAAAPVTPTTLGSLPLYGEKVPDKNYAGIPSAAQSTCAELKEAMTKVRELKQSSGGKTQSDVESQKQRGMVLFATLKKLNRLSHLFCKDTREQTHEQKLEVDDLHLQLQNLMYEAMHLRKEITNCLQFKSQHEDIDLVGEEEFYSSAPETISHPEVTREDEHMRMLGRLEWELEQRKCLATQQQGLETTVKEQETGISQKEDQLSRLYPALETLRKATLPLQGLLELPLDKLRDEQDMAILLPSALYIVYMQARAYAEVQDKMLLVSIVGDSDEARGFQNNSQVEQSDEESGDSDAEGGKEDGSRRKKHRKAGQSLAQERKKNASKSHPLTVNLTLGLKDVGSFEIALNFLPSFSAICASVVSVTLDGVSETQQNTSFIDNSALLHCLFEGDTGRTSPNSVVSLHIRKHGGDTFSTAVRQYGFPYKWVQKVCGVDSMSESQESAASVQPQVETSAEYIEVVVTALKARCLTQVYLTRQLLELDELKLLLSPDDSFPHPTQSELIRWKQIGIQEVQGLQFRSLAIFNLQERTSRFYVATLQHGTARLYSLICLSADYPATPPCFAVMIGASAGQREPHDLQTKNVEAEVNIHFPQTLEGDEKGQYLLCRQIRRLQECFDVLMEYRKTSEVPNVKSLHRIRGKGRLLVYADSN